MQFFPMNHLMTMQHLAQLDRRIIAYGVVWALAIGAALTWIVTSNS